MISDGTENKESMDQFSSYMKRRLEDHREPLDPDGWTVVWKRLQYKKRIRLALIATSVAASLLIGLFWFSGSYEMEIPSEEIVLQESTAYKEEKESLPVKEIEKEQPLLAEKVRSDIPPAPVAKRQQVSQPDEITVVEDEEVSDNFITETTDKVQVGDDPAGTNEISVMIEKKPIENTRQRTAAKIAPVSKRKGGWMVAAAFGTGGENTSIGVAPNSDFMNNFNTPGPIIGVPEIGMESWEVENNHVDVSYSIPISVGITIRKDLNRTFALESGLFYTYLSSDIEKGKVGRKPDRLELHYLGVPVNLVGYLINRPQWNLYLSGGIMLEKGLRSVYTERTYSQNHLFTTAHKGRIGGVQVSVNGAIGITYRLFDHWGIYAEPKLYYYFDTDQPISVRTERPFGFGINAGIRYHF